MSTITVIKATQPQISNEITQNKKRRVAGYARVSTDKDEQINSYEAQVEHYTKFIKSINDWDFVKVYTDEGITATSIKYRTGFQKMIHDALNGKIDLIITKSVSRFARNTIDSLQSIRKLKEHNVEVYFEKENIWTFDGKGELLITIMSSLAQEESRSISENVTWGMRESMRQGNAWVPYSVFLGYDKDKDGNWKINPEQAVLVRRIYGLYLQGMSPYHIGKLFESEGILFANGKKRWHATTVSSILKNEKYTGDALRQKTFTSDFLTKKKIKNNGEIEQYYIKDHHEAIISHETFNSVQEEFKRRGNKDKYKTGNRLFSYRVMCGDCDNWYGPYMESHGKNKGKIVWRCNHKYNKEKYHCLPPKITEDELKATVLSTINKLLQDKKLIDVFNSAKSDLFYTDGLISEKKETEKELEIAKAMLKNCNSPQQTMLNHRIEVAENRLIQLKKDIHCIKSKEKAASDYILKISENNEIHEFDEKMLFYLIDYITVNKDSLVVRLRNNSAVCL